MPSRRSEPSLIISLTDAEAASVLNQLLVRRPALREEAESIARGLLAEVDAEALAEELVTEITQVSLDDLNARAGRHSWGYVDPVEAAWELLDQRVAPYRDELLRLQELGFEEQALATLEGILMGLQAVGGRRGGHYVLETAPDFEDETAIDVVEKWVQGGGGRKKRNTLPKGLLDECADATHRWETTSPPERSEAYQRMMQLRSLGFASEAAKQVLQEIEG